MLQAIEIKKSTWHYKLYENSFHFTDNEPPEQTDLCRYRRRIMLRCFQLFLLVLFASCGLVIVAFVAHEVLMFKTLRIFAALAVVIFAGVFLQYAFINSDTGKLLAAMVKSYKDKYCAPVRFVDPQ